LYGILALFTGYHLNPLQLSHYIYSLVILGLTLYLTPALRHQARGTSAQRAGEEGRVLKVLALAWVYVLDAVINGVYTTLFGLGWFVLLAQHLGEDSAIGNLPGEKLGAGLMNDTAGFTDPEYPVAHVDIVATPAPSLSTGPSQQATIYAQGGTLAGALLADGSLASICVLGMLWVIRMHFCLIVLSFARSTLRAYIAQTSAANASYAATTSADPTLADSPFTSPSLAHRLGRAMLRLPTQRYWLGRDESEGEWASGIEGRMERARGLKIKVPTEGGLGERERRARSGTGPPVPATTTVKGA
jgi:inositol phosphorylceramide synthase regulatory subunit